LPSKLQRRIADSLLWFAQNNLYKPVLEALPCGFAYANMAFFFSLFRPRHTE